MVRSLRFHIIDCLIGIGMVCGKIFPFGIFRFFKCDFYFVIINDVDTRKIKSNVKITADLHLIVMCRNHFIRIQLVFDFLIHRGLLFLLTCFCSRGSQR